MSNTAKKILVLATVIVLAVAGILVFYPTVVAPPSEIDMENLHIKDLSSTINTFSNKREAYANNDAIYKVVMDKMSLYRKENFMSDEEADYLTKQFVQKYVPIFIDFCYLKFYASNWIESDHTAIRQRIIELKGLSINTGKTKAVTGSFLTEFGNIEGIIDKYYEAKNVAAFSSFVSVSDANAKIAKAEQYRNTEYLKNCTELVNKLAAVKVNIGNSHYSYVEHQIATLRNYRYMTKEEFDSKMIEVNGKIQEYENNKSKYGPSAKDSKGLRDKANELYYEASDYYTKPEISIDLNGQWTSFSSPNSSYWGYQSYSNWHCSSSNATMTFTIKGYASFSFKIRSNGEGNYDYVMVGINRQPTRESCYSNTKGTPNAGTSVDSYKDVPFYNLDKSSSYTIYVTYSKDSSDDRGDDRGYVLIPRPNNQ